MDGSKTQWVRGLRSRGNTFLRFFGYKHFKYVILCGLLGVVSACLLGTGFWLMYLAIDSFLGSAPLNEANTKSSISLLVSFSAPYLLVFSLFALVLGEAFFLASQIAGVFLGQSYVRELRLFLSKVFLKYGWSADSKNMSTGLAVGEWSAGVGTGVENFIRLLANGIITFILLGYCLYLDIELFFIAAGLGIFVFGAQNLIFVKFSEASQTLVSAREKTTSLGRQIGLNSSVYACTNLNRSAIDRLIAGTFGKDRAVTLRQQVAFYTSPFASKVLGFLVFGTIIIIATQHLETSIGVLIAQVVALRRVSAALNQVNMSGLEVVKGFAYFQKLYELVSSTRRALKDRSSVDAIAKVQVVTCEEGLLITPIRLLKTRFDLHQRLNANFGRLTCICGPSGVGKTQLLMALYFELSKQRVSVCMVPQEPENFSGRLAQNFLFRLPRHLDLVSRLVDRYAILRGVVPSTQRFETILEVESSTPPGSLSGGESQRLAFVRALLNCEEVLILDEFTSAQDPEMEIKMLQCLADFAEAAEIAVITVAHRTEVINSAHVIIRLISEEDGSVSVEQSR